MMKISISFFMILFSFIMLFLNHPISMGLMILIQTLLICLILGMFNYTYWFSYILFLIFMGGLLVLFIYVSSIASNELFNFNFIMKNSLILFSFFILTFSFIYMYNLNWLNFNFNYDMNNLFNMFIFFNENKINISKLYNDQLYSLMIIMIIYLFIALIAVVKITNIFYGPLRSLSF